MYSEPCAKLEMRETPKTMDSPDETKKSVEAMTSPFSSMLTAWPNSTIVLTPPGSLAPARLPAST
jgi:hypothetical protein